MVERAVIITENNTLDVEDFHFSSQKIEPKISENLNLEATEKALIESALKKHSGNMSRAAKELGITRTALYRRLEKHQI